MTEEEMLALLAQAEKSLRAVGSSHLKAKACHEEAPRFAEAIKDAYNLGIEIRRRLANDHGMAAFRGGEQQ